jgi:hypothetical protein
MHQALVSPAAKPSREMPRVSSGVRAAIKSLGSGDGLGRDVYINNLFLAHEARQSRTFVANTNPGPR